MSGLARQLWYEVPSRRTGARLYDEKAAKTEQAARPARYLALSREDKEIVTQINTIRQELECLHNRYDNTADDLLVDSLIYEIKAANMKYQYYLTLCKEKGIIGGI